MSFADYGLDVFLAGSRQRANLLKSCGDCSLDGAWSESPGWEDSCCRQIVEHLISLGVWVENELLVVKSELEKYKLLELTAAQIDRLRALNAQQEEQDKLVGSTRLEDVRAYIIDYLSDKFNRVSKNLKNVSDDIYKHDGCCKSSLQKREASANVETSETSLETRTCSSSDPACRTNTPQNDSEILSLKHRNAEKEAELKQLELQNRKLELILDKMKEDIEILESSSRVSQAQIQDVILQRNQEVEILKKNIERLERDLKTERQVRKADERDMQRLVREAQNSHNNLIEELKLAKRRIEAVEASKASQEVMVHQLQQERDNLDKQSREQENAIDKLLKMIERLNDKYKQAQTDLSGMRKELEVREQRLTQCREQLESMEREVASLISELAACLGEEPSKQPAGEELCARARRLGRGLDSLAREHAQCQERRARLLKEIDRLGQARRSDTLENLEIQAGRELARLERLVLGADNYRALKDEMKAIVDEMLARLDNRRIEKVEQAYIDVADEASLALAKLDKSISEHEDYRACESFLLLELENLQDALADAQKAIASLDPSGNSEGLKMGLQDDEADDRLAKALDSDFPFVSATSKKILQHVHNSIKIVVRITSAVREDSSSKLASSKELESRLQQAVAEVQKLSNDKRKLENECEEYKRQSEELLYEMEKLRSRLAEETSRLQNMNNETQSRLNAIEKENETLKCQVTIVEKKFLESRGENASLMKKSSSLTSKLKKELECKETKLKEYCEFNDFLNAKLEESNEMIKQLQSTIVIESARKADLDSFAALHARILELVKEKEELVEKVEALQDQLGEVERSNQQLHSNLAKIHEDNDYLEKCIKNLRCENERLKDDIARQSHINTNLGSKCEELIGKVIRFSRQSFKLNLAGDAGAMEMKKQLNSQADKLRQYQNELAIKEQEMRDKDKEIEQLTTQINKTKNENTSIFMERLELVSREKSQLKMELEQTLIKYENKLSEMHKQYKNNEIELHKKHNESIRRLEAKYLEMLKDEGKIYGSPNWLQTLNPKQLRDLHEQICKSQSCFERPCERDVYEEQKKKIEIKSARQLPVTKKAVERNLKSSNASLGKPSSRQRTTVKDILSSRSVIIPEKEYSSSPVKSASMNKNK